MCDEMAEIFSDGSDKQKTIWIFGRYSKVLFLGIIVRDNR
ncbi:hypothetical protein HMPREF3215_02174 [Staphylococcus simulans]|nr:hypothetical protein HMPREF3215_02174 [Staphylococcus simulans]